MTPAYVAPSTYNATLAASTSGALWQHLTTSFGYLTQQACAT